MTALKFQTGKRHKISPGSLKVNTIHRFTSAHHRVQVHNSSSHKCIKLGKMQFIKSQLVQVPFTAHELHHIKSEDD